MYKLLVVEDEVLIRDIIKEYFATRDYEVIEAVDGYDALDKVNQDIDMVLLDIMMPGMDGYETCKKIREKYDMTIIFISALSETDNMLDGYHVGADDYITKPFKPSVLYAKCQAILNRSKKTEKEDKETIWLDESKHLMYVDGEAVALPNKEYLLMELFLNNKNQLFTRSQILNKVWGYDYYGDGRAVDTYIKKLRKKLGVHSHRIQTIMKAGYTYTDEED